MKTFKKLSGFGAAFLMAASMGTVYAEEGDVTQSRTQERTRTEFNLQTPTADFGQSRNREEHTVMNTNQNQNRYQYQNKYMNKYQNGGSDSGGAFTQSQNKANNKWQGNNTSSSMDRMNATNRHMQGSSAAGSMNRQSTTSRSMGGRH